MPPIPQSLRAALPPTSLRPTTPFSATHEPTPLPTGLAALDVLLGGGLPRGGLSEIIAPPSAGAMSLVQQAVARTTGTGRWVAWIDGSDALDPGSLEAAGVDLRSLLWVRPSRATAALAAAEFLAGLENAFALIVLDLSRRDSPPRDQPGVPARPSREAKLQPAHWLRLAAMARRGRADVSLLLLAGESECCFPPACLLRLELLPARTLWSGGGDAPFLLDGREVDIFVRRKRNGIHGGSVRTRLVTMSRR